MPQSDNDHNINLKFYGGNPGGWDGKEAGEGLAIDENVR